MVVCLSPIFVKKQWSYVPCGKCLECKMQKSKEWAYRICLEAKEYKDNCMLTLTYNEDNLPDGETLVLKDFQNFIKRLRERLRPLKIRYFGCGEYGSLKGRPHYHIIIFGWKPDDLTYFKTDKKGYKLYRSKLLESCWKLGFSSVGDVTYDSALYTAIYLQKAPEDGRKKQFVRMSTKPGLAYASIDEQSLVTDKIYLKGKYIKTPRYFLKVLERDGVDIEQLKEDRKSRFDNDLLPVEMKAECDRRRKKMEKIFGRKGMYADSELSRQDKLKKLKADCREINLKEKLKKGLTR